MGKGLAKLAVNNKPVRKLTENAKTHFIDDQIADVRSTRAIASFGYELMTMVKALERPLLLNVGKVMIPLELGNQGNPTGAEGQKGKQAKRGDNLRAYSS